MSTDTGPSTKTFLRIPRSEWLRKAVHMGSFAPAFLLPYLTPKQAALMAIGALLFNMFVLPRLMPSIIRREGNSGYLEILMYPAAVLAIILSADVTCTAQSFCAPREPLSYIVLAWFCLAILDGWFGICYKVFSGGKSLPWNDRKSVSGFAVATLSSTIIFAVSTNLISRKLFKDGDWLGLVVMFGMVAAIALIESIWFGIADNLTIPFGVAVVVSLFNSEGSAIPRYYGGVFYHPNDYPDWIYWGIPLAFAAGAWLLKKITVGGAFFGWLAAFTLMRTEPWLFLFLFTFFFLGVIATKFGKSRKEALGIAEARGGRRGVAEIFGASAVFVWMTPLAYYHFLALPNGRVAEALFIIISPLIAKTMDTVSSEMGKAIGGTTISLRSFKVVPPGTDGGVSFAGTLWGLAAAALLAALILPLHWGGVKEVGILVAIAILANLFESYWAAWAGPRGVDDGPHTNFMMTLFAATLAWFWWM